MACSSVSSRGLPGGVGVLTTPSHDGGRHRGLARLPDNLALPNTLLAGPGSRGSHVRRYWGLGFRPKQAPDTHL